MKMHSHSHLRSPAQSTHAISSFAKTRITQRLFAHRKFSQELRRASRVKWRGWIFPSPMRCSHAKISSWKKSSEGGFLEPHAGVRAIKTRESVTK
jgi:hypothetical protein